MVGSVRKVALFGGPAARIDKSFASMHLKVRILRVLLYVSPYRRTDNVDLKVALSCPQESVLCQSRCEPQMPQLFRNFRVDQLQDVSCQTIFQIGNLSALLDFEPAGRHYLQR